MMNLFLSSCPCTMKIEGYRNINLPRDKPGDSTCQNHLPSSALQLSINKPFFYDVKEENYLILEVLAPGRHSCEYLWDLLSRFGRDRAWIITPGSSDGIQRRNCSQS